MKYLALFLTFFALPLKVSADEPTKKLAKTKNIQILLEVIKLKASDYSTLTFGEAALKTDQSFRENIQKLIDEDQADIIDTTLLSSTIGNSPEASSSYSMVSPIEYDQSLIIKQQKNRFGTKTNEAAIGLTPSEFEERSIGTSLILTPTNILKNGQVVFSIELNKNSFALFSTWRSWKDPIYSADLVTPMFTRTNLNTKLTLTPLVYHHITTTTPMLNTKQFDSKHRYLIFTKIKISN